MTTFGAGLLELAKATALLALPIVVYRGVSSLLHHLVDDEIHQVPIVTSLSRLAGFLAAGLVLAGGLGEQAFRLSEIFTPDSAWDIPTGEFLLKQGNLWSYDLPAITHWALSGDQPAALLAATLAVLSAGGALLLAPQMFARRRHRLQALAVAGVTMVLTAWQLVYLITLALWLIHRANFWSLALIALYIQYRRSRHG